MSKRERFVFVGGGSGGHFYPLMAIASALKEKRAQEGREVPDLVYMGPTPYDQAALTKHGLRFVQCAAGKTRRYASLLNILDIFKTFFGIWSALVKLFVLYPDAVMSKGGGTSVPVVIAAWFLRIPVIIHESDSVPGRANKLAATFATHIAISYTDVAAFFPASKIALTGIPIRSELLQPPRDNAAAQLGVDESIPTILVLGGSQGAERVNTLILETLDELLPSYNIIHQTGDAHINAVVETAKALITDEQLLARYHPVGFVDPVTLNDALHTASVVISRAGSTTIYETAVHGKPSILVPIPEEISHDQRSNAYAYARTGAATVMEEGNLRDGLLAAEIERIMSSREIYNASATAARSFAPQDAAGQIALALGDIADTH